MATLLSAATRVANNFQPSAALEKSQISGIIVGLYFLTLLSNACGVRIYGNLERAFKWVKLVVIVALCVFMVLVNLGVGGYPTGHKTANYTQNGGLTPYFKPDGFNHTVEPAPTDGQLGIPGAGGRLLAVWTAITLAIFACMGGDIVIVSAGEAQSPRRDLPAAARFMYLAPIALYILGSFLVGLNINYADPGLYRPWAQWQGPGYRPHSPFLSHSPFLIVLGNTSIAPNVLPYVFNAFFLFSAWTAANTALFVASRTLFSVAHLYGNSFLKRTIGRTNNGHTPLAAIICCSLFCFLAFLGLTGISFDQPILSMSSFFSTSIACVYSAECIAYIRFKKGLSILEKDGILSRNWNSYRSKHYRAHWQPMWAYLGLFGCTLIILFSGWTAAYLIQARGSLNNPGGIKHDNLLAWDLVGSYLGPTLFFTLYITYKMLCRFRIIDRDAGFRSFEGKDGFRNAYILPDIDNLPFDQELPTPKRDWRYWCRETWSFIR